jgi:hypothetical protein
VWSFTWKRLPKALAFPLALIAALGGQTDRKEFLLDSRINSAVATMLFDQRAVAHTVVSDEFRRVSWLITQQYATLLNKYNALYL